MKTKSESQLASRVLMIRPVRFESNPLTAASNRFQGKTGLDAGQQQDAALREFDGLVGALRAAGIDVIVVEDTPEPHTPDSIFPNNWISYARRRAGRACTRWRQRIVATSGAPISSNCLHDKSGLLVSEVIDLTAHENAGHYLEGTGSMVLDRANRIAYACLSSRTHLDALGDFAQRMDYDVIAFDAVDSDGVPIYHTNVLMNVGERLAVVCDAAIPRAEQRAAVIEQLKDTGHEVISLSYAQLNAFAGNMLELQNDAGERIIAMSRRALESLSDEQRGKLSANGRIVSVPIDTIEASAGGSVRCMLAEVHLPGDRVSTMTSTPD